MQATLSNIASGKTFRNRPSTATPTHLSRHHVTTPRPLLAAGHPQEVVAPQLAEGLGLAHDAGNLLGALGLYCDLLASPGVLRDEHRHYAEELQLLSGRSRDLIDRLLNPTTASRSGIQGARSATQGAETEQVVVPDVIEGCRGLLNAVARRAVAVAYGAGAALPVSVSREALERILVNLTKNAAEAMDADVQGAITLRVVCELGKNDLRRIVLTVEDRGRGMNSAAVKILTTPVPSGAVRPGPRGLGFQVVRELVGASGGQLRLRSQDEGSSCGTTVEVTWFVAASDVHLMAPAEKRKTAVVASQEPQSTSIAGRASC